MWVHVTCAWFVPELRFRNIVKMEPAEGLINVHLSMFQQVYFQFHYVVVSVLYWNYIILHKGYWWFEQLVYPSCNDLSQSERVFLIAILGSSCACLPFLNIWWWIHLSTRDSIHHNALVSYSCTLVDVMSLCRNVVFASRYMECAYLVPTRTVEHTFILCVPLEPAITWRYVIETCYTYFSMLEKLFAHVNCNLRFSPPALEL